MQTNRQIFTPRRFAAAFGTAALCVLSACASLDDAIRRLQSETTQNQIEMPAPPETAPSAEPSPPNPEMETAEVMKPPADNTVRMASKTPMASKPRPRKPGVPNEQPQPKPPAPGRIMPADLIGSDFAEVLRLIRQPDTVQTNALAIVWTYSEPVCKLQLFFYPDIETTTFHVLKYDLRDAAGEKLDNPGQCMQRIVVARNDAASSP
jgi:hypothetical protein